MSFSFVCTYNVAFKSRSCSLWAPVVSWFWDSGYMCTVSFGYICSVLFRNIRICTLSCASHKQHSCSYQYKPRAFAEKPAFSSFSLWMNAVSLHEQGELASPHWAKSPEVLCTQNCLRLWWELHGYKTFRTVPKMNESCSGLRSSHASALNCSSHDMTITEKQNHPGWLMIIDLILLTADGRAEKSKESFCSRELQPFVRPWVTEHHSEETQWYSPVVQRWFRAHTLSCDNEQ